MDKVRWGLLTTANINRKLIPAIRASSRGQLTAVASRNLTKVKAYAAEWGIPKVFGSYDEMLESDDVDAVYISLPNHLHAEWTVKALNSGKHVLCEKPLALSLEEVDQMKDAAEKNGRALAEAFMYRHHPQTKIVGEWVRSGRLGDITYLEAFFSFKGMDADNVRLVPEWGGGGLWDIGIYPISLSQYVMGSPPEWVVGDQVVGDSGVDMVFSGHMHYSGQRVAHISCSFQTPFHTFAQIIGTDGILTLYRPFLQMDDGTHLYFTSNNGEREQVSVPAKELYLGEVQDMNGAILDGKKNYITLEESRNHVRTALALYTSAKIGARSHL
jgi:predicted dehydrogenase